MTEQGAYANALALCRAGLFGDAERELRALVERAPADAQALQLLGIALSSMGRVEESLEWFDRAKAARPGSIALMQNRAQSLLKLQRLAEARAELESLLAVAPGFPAALELLGHVLAAQGDRAGAEVAFQRALPAQAGAPFDGPDAPMRRQAQQSIYDAALAHHAAGRLDEAILGYRQALAAGPGFSEAYVNLGNALKMKGRHEESHAHYAEAYRVDPAFPDALTNYGSVLREAGRIGEALPLLERAVAARPDSPTAQNNLGIAYFEMDRFDDAVRCYRRAIALRPAFTLARNNLGNALAALGRNEEAIAEFREVIASSPQEANTYSNLGIVLHDMGDVEAAIECYSKALALRPDFAPANTNMGFLLQEEGRLDEAMRYFETALRADPAYARAEYNLALAHLYRFEFARGWKLHQARYRTVPPVAVERSFPFPRFTAADGGAGRRLAVWREQGVGDQVLYSTLLPDLEARGQEFAIEIDIRLVPAMRRAHPSWNVTGPDRSSEVFSACDRHASMGDLAGLLRPSRESFDAQPRALLRADPQRVRQYRERVRDAGAPVVGLSWRSFQPSQRGFVRRKKSAPLDAFMALSQRVHLVDLQYGDTQAEREAFERSGGRLDRIEGLDLFADLEGVMAAIEACDVVVTTSNVTAHMAGALGKRTLLMYLSANSPFHYSVTDASGRCLWYPSLTVVTGAAIDTWSKALDRVEELLGG